HTGTHHHRGRHHHVRGSNRHGRRNVQDRGIHFRGLGDRFSPRPRLARVLHGGRPADAKHYATHGHGFPRGRPKDSSPHHGRRYHPRGMRRRWSLREQQSGPGPHAHRQQGHQAAR